MTVLTAYFECPDDRCTFGVRAIKDSGGMICPVCFEEGRGVVEMREAPKTVVPHRGSV